jgi:uncharacterized DUF497 family protein
MTTREIEFDPEKAAINLQVHKINFEDAALFLLTRFESNAGMTARETQPGKNAGKPWVW